MSEDLGPSLRSRRGRVRGGSAALILAAYCRVLGVIPPSSRKLQEMIVQQFDPDLKMDANLNWFMGHSGTCPLSDSPYTKAHLRTYYEIGDQFFYPFGITLTGGHVMNPGRAMMKTLLDAGYVKIIEAPNCHIEITDVGRAWVSDVPAIDENAPFDFFDF